MDGLQVEGLAVGLNAVRVVATSEDGAATQVYSVDVRRREPSKDASLKDLYVAMGRRESFAFFGGDNVVIAPVQSVHVVGRAADGTTLAVEGLNFTLNDVPRKVNCVSGLQRGMNRVEVEVTAQDAITRTVYSINLLRR